MIRALYEAITGRPWTTTRSAAAEFGPPPGAVYADQLAAYSDTDLILHGRSILRDIRTRTRVCGSCNGTGSVLHLDPPSDVSMTACPDCRPQQHAVDLAHEFSK